MLVEMHWALLSRGKRSENGSHRDYYYSARVPLVSIETHLHETSMTASPSDMMIGLLETQMGLGRWLNL